MKRSYITVLVILVLVVFMCSLASCGVQASKVDEAPAFILLAKESTAQGVIMAYKLEMGGRVYVSIVFVGDGWGEMNTVEWLRVPR